MAQQELFNQMARILVPEMYLKDFEVNSIKEQPNEWLIELIEMEDRIPTELTGKDVVLDGYCNSVDVLTHAFSLKKIYLRFHRRRWKERGSTVHFQNQYDLHLAGAKITPTLGAFLKEAFG
jgi:hypothetical protein